HGVGEAAQAGLPEGAALPLQFRVAGRHAGQGLQAAADVGDARPQEGGGGGRPTTWVGMAKMGGGARGTAKRALPMSSKTRGPPAQPVGVCSEGGVPSGCGGRVSGSRTAWMSRPMRSAELA